MPYPVFLVLGGLAIGFVPGLPEVEIAPEVIFLVFLPPLLSAAAFFSSPLDLRAHLRPILLLAIGSGVEDQVSRPVVSERHSVSNVSRDAVRTSVGEGTDG